MKVKEHYQNDNGVIKINFTITNAPSSLSYSLGDLSKTKFTHSKGKLKDGKLVLSNEEAKSFSLTFEPKK